MLSEPQVEAFYPDLSDERVVSALALVHSRFSTNTFPAWPLAHPYRYVAHNGEINTLRGNRNWMAAREALLSSNLIPGDLARLSPIVTPDASDSATFDEVLELLHLGGRIPAARGADDDPGGVGEPRRDGSRPAAPSTSSTPRSWSRGTGPRSSRSPTAPSSAPCSTATACAPPATGSPRTGWSRWRPRSACWTSSRRRSCARAASSPAACSWSTRPAGKLVDDAEIKGALAAEHPYEEWLHAGLIHLGDLADREREVPSHAALTQRQQSIGYTEEELGVLLKPMAASGAEPIGSMGNDAPLAAISARPRQLFDYFNQLFAQVTNPPLGRDPRGAGHLARQPARPGAEPARSPARRTAARSCCPSPVLTNDDLAQHRAHQRRRRLPRLHLRHRARHVPRRRRRARACEERLRQICTQVSEAIEDGARLIVLSQRGVTKDFAPIPSLLLTGAVHQHLVRERTRTRVGLLVEAGDAREVHHIALLIGYGAAAVNPYLAMATVEDLADARRHHGHRLRDGGQEPGQGAGQGRAQDHVEDRRLHGGVLHRRADLRGGRPRPRGDRHLLHRHHVAAGRRRLRRARRGGAHPPPPGVPVRRDPGARTARWRSAASTSGGARASCTCSTRPRCSSSSTPPAQGRYEIFKEYTRAVDEQAHKLMTLRGLFRFKGGARPPVDIDEVEPVDEIVKRFATGAISYGSISKEMHETLAIAMNRLGGKSNTGRGRRGRRPLHPRRQRRQPPQRHQAGRVRPVRRHQRVPGQRRRPADQDQPGRQAGRGRPAARRQGLPVDREDPRTRRRASG